LHQERSVCYLGRLVAYLKPKNLSPDRLQHIFDCLPDSLSEVSRPIRVAEFNCLVLADASEEIFAAPSKPLSNRSITWILGLPRESRISIHAQTVDCGAG
jgi:hypothetical protein